MAIDFTCPNCQRSGRLPDNFTGNKIKCPACQTISPVANTEDVIPLAPEPVAAARQRAPDAETAGRRPAGARVPGRAQRPAPVKLIAAVAAEECSSRRQSRSWH